MILVKKCNFQSERTFETPCKSYLAKKKPKQSPKHCLQVHSLQINILQSIIKLYGVES